MITAGTANKTHTHRTCTMLCSSSVGIALAFVFTFGVIESIKITLMLPSLSSYMILVTCCVSSNAGDVLFPFYQNIVSCCRDCLFDDLMFVRYYANCLGVAQRMIRLAEAHYQILLFTLFCLRLATSACECSRGVPLLCGIAIEDWYNPRSILCRL